MFRASRLGSAVWGVGGFMVSSAGASGFGIGDRVYRVKGVGAPRSFD